MFKHLLNPKGALHLQRGSILIEFLAVMALAAVFSEFLLVQSSAFWQYYYKNQVRLVAQLLAADLRALQQETLFEVGTPRDIKTSSQNKSVYGIYLTRTVKKRVAFDDYGCGDVYFKYGVDTLRFSYNGAPSQTVNSSYSLGHAKLANFSCRVEVQPVTGRVLVYEEE